MPELLLIVAGILLAGLGGCAGQTEIKFTPHSTLGTGPHSTSPAAGAEQLPGRFKPLTANEPVDITSDRMQYQEQGKVTLFKGRVKVQQENTQLYTPYLEVRSEDGLALARQGVQLFDHTRGVTVVAQELDYRNNLSHVIVRKNVNLWTQSDQGQSLRVRSDELEWRANQGIGEARGNVKVYYQDITATAGKMHYTHTDQRLILEADPENPKIFPEMLRGQDVLTGETITVQVKDKSYIITGSARAVIMPQNKPKPALKENEKGMP